MHQPSPQIEDGYTRIANELFDAIIKHPFSRREYAVIMSVIRVTYGFNKKEDAVSGWQLSEMTGIDRSHISKTLADLVQKKILIKSDRCRMSHGQFIPFLSINKHYKTWLTVAETAMVKTVAELATVAKTAPLPNQPSTVAETATVTVAELATAPLLNQPTHKDIPKDNKDITKRHDQQPAATDRKSIPDTELQIACRKTWEAYAIAYEKRYGAKPIRNKTLSSQIKAFVGRIGFVESPLVAEFYLSHQEPFYQKKFHPVGTMLSDCEKLRTEWATGRSFEAQAFKSSGERRLDNTNRAVAEFLGEPVNTGTVIDGEFNHA